jgi:S-methylmethionine-dependent homocysteine/selenocysteine methylase
MHYSYQTTDLPDASSMQAQYTDIVTALQPYVDIFLAETLSTAAEARAALAAAAHAAPGV